MGNYFRRSYHSSRVEWRHSRELEGGHIGIEFEVEADNDNGYEHLLDLLPDFPEGEGPITESDGSLSDWSGVEIIFPPVPYAELKKPTSVFRRSIAALNGHTFHHSITGMHMNVNIRGWSHRKKALFLAVIHNLSMTQIERLGGRRTNEYCGLYPGRSLQTYLGYRSSHGRAAECPSDYRMELRFPQSTTNPDRINLLVDFIERLDKFLDTVPEDWTPAGGMRRIGGNTYGYSEELYDYTDLFSRFYKYLSRTKKGRRVLRVLQLGFSHFNDEDEVNAIKESGARPARNIASAAA